MPNCRSCGQTVETWDDWFSGDCPADPSTGHDLPWTEIMFLPGWDISKPSKLIAHSEWDGMRERK